MNPPMTQPASDGMREFEHRLRALVLHVREDVRQKDTNSRDAVSLATNEVVGLHDAALARADEADSSFKNFHRSLCERFGYTHDERDWKRDQVSLEEHIAAKIEHPAEPPVSMREAFEKTIDVCRQMAEGALGEVSREVKEAALRTIATDLQAACNYASRPTSEPVGVEDIARKLELIAGGEYCAGDDVPAVLFDLAKQLRKS